MTAPDKTPRAGDTRLSSAIIRAVSNHADKDSVDLPPLYEVIEPDALDKLFGPMADGVPREGGEVRFSYAGRRVTITLNRSFDIEVQEESE